MYKCNHFKIYELVSPLVYNKYGETAWQFIDPRLLITLDWLREHLGKPITINDWYWKGRFTQRGIRCNMDPMMVSLTEKGKVYCSPHPFGQAADFDVKGMTAEQVRNWINEHQDELPYPIRMELGVNWNHLDVRDTGVKVYFFNP